MNELDQLVEVMESGELRTLLENRDPAPVRAALRTKRKSARDLAILLSPGGDLLLEEIARAARDITLERFGNIMGLYVPLYLSNHCIGRCPYCGFRAGEKIVRRILTLQEVSEEVRVIEKYGMRDVLLVAGEAPGKVTWEYLRDVVSLVRQTIPSVCLEVAPMPGEAYGTLAEAGVSGVTLYQETFDRNLYSEMHSNGPKADYRYRIESLDRAGAAGIRKLTTGALFGLAPWRLEGLRLGLHAQYLQKRWWRSSVSVGLPRLHSGPSDFEIRHPMDDRALVHLIVALRVFSEDLGIAISTRETPEFRNNLLGLGVTYMSAGSKTEPGGYSENGVSGNQFEVADLREPTEVAQGLVTRGYDPVWKDWDYGFGGQGD